MFTEVRKPMSSRYTGKRNSKFLRKFGYVYRLRKLWYTTKTGRLVVIRHLRASN